MKKLITVKNKNILLKKAILGSEVIIPIITSYSLKSKSFLNELIQLRNYTSQRNDKLLIPIVAGEINFENFPESILSINFITLKNKLSENEINEVVKKSTKQ